jgi:hypothetical protein
VLSKYPQVLTDVPCCTNVLEYEIKVTSNDPIKLKSYPIPYAMIDQVDSEIEKNAYVDFRPILVTRYLSKHILNVKHWFSIKDSDTV